MGLDDISDIDAAYMAGVLDSDGCIQISRRDCRRNNNIQYNLDVRVSNTSIDLIDWTRFMLDGAGYVYSNFTDNRPPRNNPCYTLSITGETAYKLLKRLQPFVKGKKKQLQLALDFISIKGTQRGNRQLKPIYPMLQDMYEEMRELKILEPAGGIRDG